MHRDPSRVISSRPWRMKDFPECFSGRGCVRCPLAERDFKWSARNAAKKEFHESTNKYYGSAETLTNNVKYKNIWKTRSRVFLWSHFWATPMEPGGMSSEGWDAGKGNVCFKNCGSRKFAQFCERQQKKREKTINFEPFLGGQQQRREISRNCLPRWNK